MSDRDDILFPFEHHVPLFRGPRGRSYFFPYSVMIILFFLWAFAFSLLDILNRNYMDFLDISVTQSKLIPLVGFMGYLASVIPAGLFIKKHGYKKGILAGTTLFATGALFFVIASFAYSQLLYFSFLFSFFILTGGIGFIETAACPYICVLGPMETAEQRTNLAHSFKILGWIFGPVIGAALINERHTDEWMELSELIPSYRILGFSLLAVTFLFLVTKMPKPREEKINGYGFAHTRKPLIEQDTFIKSIIALFFYYAAFIGICSIFEKFSIEIYSDLSKKNGIGPDMVGDLVNLVQKNVRESCAGEMECTIRVLARYTFSLVAMGALWLGRFLSSIYLAFVKPERMLTLFTLISIVLLGIVIYGPGIVPLIALLLSFFSMSVIYPIVFACGVKGLGIKTRMAAPFLNLAVAGGLFTPWLMEYIANHHGTIASFYIPVLCLMVVLAYGIDGYPIGQRLIKLHRKK